MILSLTPTMGMAAAILPPPGPDPHGHGGSDDDEDHDDDDDEGARPKKKAKTSDAATVLTNRSSVDEIVGRAAGNLNLRSGSSTFPSSRYYAFISAVMPLSYYHHGYILYHHGLMHLRIFCRRPTQATV